MSKPFIFVSCGQYTESEKSLGKSIVKMIKTITGLDAFFAEEIQDLNGLDSSILGALRDCAAFITVMHPRGKIVKPDNSTHIRASVWIEQEIAIATYIQRMEKRPRPVIAFIHESVGREGIRDLLHLNPIQFRHESEVLAALPDRLSDWKTLTATGIQIQVQAGPRVQREGHWTRQLAVSLVNDSNERIASWNCLVSLPTGVLSHWSAVYLSEVKSENHRYRCFRFDESSLGAVSPHTTGHPITFDYCTQCAVEHSGEGLAVGSALVAESLVEVKFWIDNREYSVARTVKELSEETEARK
jgi:hypothetical protein